MKNLEFLLQVVAHFLFLSLLSTSVHLEFQSRGFLAKGFILSQEKHSDFLGSRWKHQFPESFCCFLFDYINFLTIWRSCFLASCVLVPLYFFFTGHSSAINHESKVLCSSIILNLILEQSSNGVSWWSKCNGCCHRMTELVEMNEDRKVDIYIAKEVPSTFFQLTINGNVQLYCKL